MPGRVLLCVHRLGLRGLHGISLMARVHGPGRNVTTLVYHALCPSPSLIFQRFPAARLLLSPARVISSTEGKSTSALAHSASSYARPAPRQLSRAKPKCVRKAVQAWSASNGALARRHRADAPAGAPRAEWRGVPTCRTRHCRYFGAV